MLKPNKILNKEGVFLGPTYLETFTTKIKSNKELENIEWKAKLNFQCNQIKFYGITKLFYKDTKLLIISSNYSKQMIVAKGIKGNEVLLFDACKHGYNAMFCDKFSLEQIKNRPINQIYPIKNQSFEIIISAYYQIDFDDELEHYEVDENGLIETMNGSAISIAELKRNAFDCFQILIKYNKGEVYSILEEETA